jgi:hypothetical protein
LQDGVVARWQLIRAGLSERSAECWLRGMQPLRDGVYVTGLAPPTQRQLWWAAVRRGRGAKAEPLSEQSRTRSCSPPSARTAGAAG